MQTAIDLFDGCGGMGHALAGAGYDVLGVESWGIAARSSQAAGHRVLNVDVRTLDPRDFHGFNHFHASPPCTTFSSAGNGAGRQHLEELTLAVKRVLHGEDHGLADPDETTLLTLEPARWLAEVRPQTISFEQVRAVLPVWEAYAEGLRDLGYSVWTKLISAETLGVPQTRVRAWLGAHHTKEVTPPTATHSAYYPRTPEKMDTGVLPWVSMADALGWGITDRPCYTVTAGGSDTGGSEPLGRGARDGMQLARSAVASGRWQPRQPSSTLTHSADSWVWKFVAPAGITGDVLRPTSAPCPTITGAGTHYLVESEADFPGRGASGYEKNGMRLSVEEALILQGFPADYPLQGSRTAQFKQVGNAVPPPVGYAVVQSLRGAA